MVLFQEPLSLTRFITIYIAQGLVFAVFLFLAFKILKRDRKRLNVIFASFYISPVFGLLINFIYGPLTEEAVIIALNFITNFGIFYAPIFLVVFELILLKSEKVITSPKQLIILIVYGIAMFSMIFFLLIPEWGVEINVVTGWSPKWSFPFFIYLVIIESFAVLPALFLSFRILGKFEDEILKKKWKYFIYGFCALAIFMYGIFVSNFLGITIFRTIMGLIGLILAICGGYLMYYGVGRQIEK
ncbi:MAG: hypothetical protein ACFFA8_03900 [Promethearchaeota archaeon]